LKKSFDDVERDCGLINKREALLNVKKTEFGALAKVQDDLKPLHALWTVAHSFCETMPIYIEKPFEKLNAGQIEK
jgi:hypothetical protein